MLLLRALFLTLLAVPASYNTAFGAFAEKLNQRPEFNYLGTAIVDVLTPPDAMDCMYQNHQIVSRIFCNYTPFRNERDNLFHYFSVMKSSKNKFYFFTCILPDYVAHESPKEF